MIKLDLGAGTRSPDGFTPLGNINGSSIYPLPYGDGTIDVIRASHVLEHFGHGEIAGVLKEWVRVLKVGGQLKIAVPDFSKIAENYVGGAQQNTMGYVMGGQVDGADYHKSLFDAEQLKRAMAGAGLMMIRPWTSELGDDCAALPITLNLAGIKPYLSEISVSAVMSVPRLGFMDNFFSSIEALPSLRVKLRRYTGAFWEQCIERVIEETIEQDNPDFVLTIDYDTVFGRRDLATMMQLVCCNPDIDALAPIQSGRGKESPLFTMDGDDGRPIGGTVSTQLFSADVRAATTAHFGLTLLRAEKLKALRKPWFRSEPAPDGGWGEGRMDADVSFWAKWKAAGNTLALANRVVIGHLELAVLWPGRDLQTIHQSVADWRRSGPPEEVWQ